MGDRAINDMVPGDTTAGQNATGGNRRKSYSEVVTEGVKRIARAFVGDSRVRKTGRALNKGDDVVVCFTEATIEAITERVKKCGSGQGCFYFSTRND